MIKYISKLVSSKKNTSEKEESAIINKPTVEELLSIQVSNTNYNNDGITINAIDDFISKCGIDNLINKTTYEIVQQFIIPITRPQNISFANYIRQSNPAIVNVYKANLLVCHSWSYRFVDVIDAIRNYIVYNGLKNDQIFLYFDVFSVNHNNDNQITTDWLKIAYSKIINKIKHTLLVLSTSSNDERSALTRTFALFEIFSTVKNNGKLSITMSTNDMNNFKIKFGENVRKVLKDTLNNIKLQDSQVNNTNKETFLSAIETICTIESADKLIRNKVYDCIIDIMTREIDKEDDIIKRTNLLSTVATLHKSRGSFEIAEELFTRNLDELKIRLGYSSPEIWHLSNSLGIFYTKAKRFEQAEAIHLEIIAYREANGMEHDLETLTTKSNLGSLYHIQGKYDLARLYYQTCLLGRKRVLGDSDKAVLETQSNLALTIVEIAKSTKNFLLFDEALELYLSTLARRKVIFGPKHQLVMETQNLLGSLYYCKGDLDHAELLFTEIYENSNNLIEDNPRRYLTALSNYASTCQALGKLEKAFELFLTANQIYMSKFGEDDIDSLISFHNLGSILFSMNKFDESIKILETCVEKRKGLLGLTHESTLTTMNLLGLVYCAIQQYQLAEPLLKFVLEHKKEDISMVDPISRNNKSSSFYAPKGSTSEKSSPTSMHSTKATPTNSSIHSPKSPSRNKSSPNSKSPRNNKNYNLKGIRN